MWIRKFLKKQDYEMWEDICADDILFQNFIQMLKAKVDVMLNIIKTKIFF